MKTAKGVKGSRADATLGDVAHFPQDLLPDESTYRGRFLHFLSMTDPRTLLTTPTRLALSEELLERVGKCEHGWQDVTVADYLDARQRVQCIVHPESRRPILLPFRFSAFVPMNFINLCGMLAPSQQTPVRGMLWQFSNQTYNVGFNYCNGSGKDGLPMRELFLGYCVATCTACGISYTMSRLTTSSSVGAFWKLMIPYTAVASANIANLSVIRFRDVLHGIPVQDPETGKDLNGGKPSVVAGRLAVAQVALSRVMIPVPLMLIPPLLLNFLFNPVKGISFFVKRHAQLYLPMNVLTLVSVLCVALPMSIAVFPQTTVVPVTWLEKPFQRQHNELGHEVTHAKFNKGL
ncbi:sre-2/carboxylate carrier-like protein [Leptomonas seymouri]|uniref:Sre-2/carboxylate carrier-like protein n=1 Tax=Leptomonas seymouri TaxID=5684 RepID=A0A0N0P786_LEPSE|nr:sre-2/carboxylate carrier-like protein [Leptomonas seymouri]|eukprot:KPI88037.1 sre-2/carboxylate carrier-like protein [Leptomonas seymouri]